MLETKFLKNSQCIYPLLAESYVIESQSCVCAGSIYYLVTTLFAQTENLKDI